MRVLFVEDDRNVSRAMLRWLGRRGCEVTHHHTRAMGLIALADSRFTFDAVITDWMLWTHPREDNNGTAEAIVSAAQSKRIPVRVFSGSQCPSDELASIWLGKTDLEGLEAFLKEVRGG